MGSAAGLPRPGLLALTDAAPTRACPECIRLVTSSTLLSVSTSRDCTRKWPRQSVSPSPSSAGYAHGSAGDSRCVEIGVGQDRDGYDPLTAGCPRADRAVLAGEQSEGSGLLSRSRGADQRLWIILRAARRRHHDRRRALCFDCPEMINGVSRRGRRGVGSGRRRPECRGSGDRRRLVRGASRF